MPRVTSLSMMSLLTLIPTITAAQETGWSYTVAAGLEREPTYVGSDEATNEAFADVELRYLTASGIEWSGGLGGVGVAFRPWDEALLNLTLEYETGRDSSADSTLTGFADIADTWEFQAVYEHELGPIDLGVGFQTDVLNKGKGLVGFVGAGYDMELSDRLELGLGLDLSFANAEHMHTEVGVSQAASKASGLAQYEAPGGYKGATLDIEMSYQLTQTTSLFAEVALETYGSAISDSPLVRDEGSNFTQELAIGVAFDF